MKKKGLAIKIASGVLVVALIVVVALAISGVFSGKQGTEPVSVSAEDASVSNTAVLRNVATDKVFYVSSTRAINDINSFVGVRANGEDVILAKADKKDENGNIGFIPADGKWAAGVSYLVTLKSSDIAFVEDQYKDMTSFIFIVDAPEAMDCELTSRVVNLTKGGYDVEVIGTDENGNANMWTLTIYNVDSMYASDVVFVYDEKLDLEAIGEDGVINSYAWKVSENQPATLDGTTYMATVVNAEIDDVFEELNVHTTVGITEDTFSFNEDATINSIMNSDMFLSTVKYLYAEQLGNKSFKLGDYCTLVFDYDFKTGSPSYATANITLTFSGFLKSAKNASVVIKVANVLTPEFHGNFQKDPLAFDASLDLSVDTVVTVDGQFAYTFDNTDDNNNTEANTALKDIVAKVASIVSDTIKSENKTEKSFIFATWVIPIGTTPIQVVESMGIEVKADLKAKLGASMKNELNVELGLTYCDNKVTPISNVKDEFKMGTVTLWGTLETKLGLYNEIGITACGIISVDLDLSVGAYCDLAGRLEMEGWEIMNGKFGLDPAYYIETGIYLDMDISGKVLVFNIKKQNLLSKKWPLWSSGYKYIPSNSQENSKYTETEDYYMSGSYFFFTNFETFAIDIQNINDTGSVRYIDWDQFNYTLDSNYLTMTDNKVRVTSIAPNKFETDIIVTSKVNKGWSKTIHVIKTPEAPTANIIEKRYESGSTDNLDYAVRLNTSKFIGLSMIEGNSNLISAGDYEYKSDESILTIKSKFLNTLSFGTHTITFESSKGYLQLYVDIYSDKSIEPAGGFAMVTFDKATPNNAEFAMNLYGNKIDSIDGLDADQWLYSASGKLKILSSALMQEEVGVNPYRIHFSNGTSAQLTVKIVDNRLPKLYTKAYDYKLGCGNELKLDVDMYSNKVNGLVINNKAVALTYLTDEGNGIKASFFANYTKAETINGYFTVEGSSQKFNFSVDLYKDEVLVLPVKYVAFDKNSAKDVVLSATIPDSVETIACVNNTIAQSVGAGFVQGSSSITIKADYLIGLESGEYTFELRSNAKNKTNPTFIIIVSDSTAPVMSTETIKLNKGSVENYNVAWSLAEVDYQSIVIEGLTQDQYTATEKYLQLHVSALDYGTTEFKVVTPVNAFDLTVVVDGTARWTQKSYTFRVSDGEALALNVDLAGKRVYDLKVLKDGKEVEIYNTQFRYNNGVITLSNDFAYNLEEGKYTVSVYTAENEKLDSDATLTVVGKLTAYTAVSNCDGSSANPYEIYTKAQFLDMIKETNLKLGADSFDGVYFKLMADIDLANATIDPIGKKGAPFKGGFDGNGYTISNFKITDVNNDYTGLFAYNAGSISDLRLNNVTIEVSKAGSVGIGIVVGNNSGSITRISVVNGKINAVSKSWMDIKNAYFDIGGLVGYNEGSIKKCNATVEINAEVKGLSVAGINIGGRKSCINVGAIVGYFKSGKVTRCDVTADINAKAHNDNVTSNGWYGNTELSESELEDSIGKSNVKVSLND